MCFLKNFALVFVPQSLGYFDRSREVIEILPPVCSAAIRRKGMPSPTLRVVRVVQNGSVTRRIISSLIP